MAGNTTSAGGSHATAATTGRYAGRKAAAYAISTHEPIIATNQARGEKNRVHKPVKQVEGIGWKELRAGIARIMQNYCGEYKQKANDVKAGLRLLKHLSA